MIRRAANCKSFELVQSGNAPYVSPKPRLHFIVDKAFSLFGGKDTMHQQTCIDVCHNARILSDLDSLVPWRGPLNFTPAGKGLASLCKIRGRLGL